MPTSLEAIFILILVLTPGYIFAQVARRSIAHIPESTDLRFVLTVVSLGTTLHAVLYPFWTRRIAEFYLSSTVSDHLTETYLWALVAILLLPLIAGSLAGRFVVWAPVDKVLDWIGLGYIDRLPSAWDYVVRNRAPCFVKVFLNDGSMIGGIYADQSVASINPERRDLFLERVWNLDDDGNFVPSRDVIPDNVGVWIAHDSIARIEFFTEGDDERINDSSTATVPD